MGKEHIPTCNLNKSPIPITNVGLSIVMGIPIKMDDL